MHGAGRWTGDLRPADTGLLLGSIPPWGDPSQARPHVNPRTLDPRLFPSSPAVQRQQQESQRQHNLADAEGQNVDESDNTESVIDNQDAQPMEEEVPGGVKPRSQENLALMRRLLRAIPLASDDQLKHMLSAFSADAPPPINPPPPAHVPVFFFLPVKLYEMPVTKVEKVPVKFQKCP